MPNDTSGSRAEIAALVAHPLEPAALRLRGERGVASAPERIFVRGHRPPHLGRAIGFQPGAGFTAELIEIGHDVPIRNFGRGIVAADLSGRIADFNMPAPSRMLARIWS
jgi:hypothetical protein